MVGIHPLPTKFANASKPPRSRDGARENAGEEPLPEPVDLWADPLAPECDLAFLPGIYADRGGGVTGPAALVRRTHSRGAHRFDIGVWEAPPHGCLESATTRKPIQTSLQWPMPGGKLVQSRVGAQSSTCSGRVARPCGRAGPPNHCRANSSPSFSDGSLQRDRCRRGA